MRYTRYFWSNFYKFISPRLGEEADDDSNIQIQFQSLSKLNKIEAVTVTCFTWDAATWHLQMPRRS